MAGALVARGRSGRGRSARFDGGGNGDADCIRHLVQAAGRGGVAPEVNAIGVACLVVAGLAAALGWWAMRRGAALAGERPG